MNNPNLEHGPNPKMGELIEEVLNDPDTRQTQDFGGKILGTGDVEKSEYIYLKGWHDLIPSNKQWGGSLTLTHHIKEKYTLWRLRESDHNYTLQYSYATDSEGRTSATLFTYTLDTTEPVDMSNEAAAFLKAHITQRDSNNT